MKDLIIITAFCPDQKKQTLLDNLLNFFQNYKNIFDIMVVSHTPLDLEKQKKCDYVIFDKENLLLYDDEIRPKIFFENESFVVCSNHVSKFSTSFTVLKLESMGVAIAKVLGYQKIHKIEYDTELLSVSELLNNSKLLESNDVVFYTNEGKKDKFMVGNLWSATIDSLPYFYYKYEKKEVLEILYDNKDLSPEWLVKKFFLKKKYLIKNSNKLIDLGVKLGLSHDDEVNDRGLFIVPIIHDENGDLFIFTYNNKNIKLKINILYDSDFFEYEVHPQNWNLKLLDKSDNFKSLSIWVNEQNTINLNSDQINKSEFRRHNFLKKK